MKTASKVDLPWNTESSTGELSHPWVRTDAPELPLEPKEFKELVQDFLLGLVISGTASVSQAMARIAKRAAGAYRR
jgi:hypothetical protein